MGPLFAISGELYPCEQDNVGWCVGVYVYVSSTSLPTPLFTSSKVLKCANLKHDTFSLKRKKKN